jgi:pimeloyl-ACP methyl ester carboxylesterase
MLSVQLALFAAATLGWSDITVSPSKGGSSQAGWQRSIGALTRPSERTVETLKRYDLESRYRYDAGDAIGALERAARKSPEPELVFALAELSWIEGRRLDGRRLFGHRRGSTALDRYVDTVGYAHDFLFDPELAAGRQPTDPRYRLACDLYNGGLDRLIRAAQTKGRIQPGDTIRLKIHGDEQTLRVELANSSWEPKDVDELILASDLEVTGLDSRSRQYGLGVPLLSVRRTDHSGRGEDEFFPPEMAFPLTAFVRPNSRLRDTADTDSRDCTLVLHDPVRTHAVGEGRDALLLEADFTTPLASMWSKTDLEKYRWTGLLRPGTAPDRATLMLLRPYEKDKIPVVMVHGLWSTPLAWIPMLNELLRDDRIRDHYQFLLYLYPTGVPVPIAAAGLRDSLLRAQRSFDPDGTNAAFEQMVLLGHSMGGLLSHAMVVSSGNRWWELNTDKQFDDITGPPDVLAELKHYNFFDALPFVSRVVFLATPHRGSDMSRGFVGKLGSNLISEPDYYNKLLAQLIKANPDAFDYRRFRHLGTSIDTLEPPTSKSPNVLSGLLAMKPSETAKLHSIMGALRPVGVQETTDGVVPYWSSHLDGVLSERVVRSDHAVQKDPEAILEVRRILLEHTGQSPIANRASGTAPAR